VTEGTRLEDPDELLHRQVHPSFVQEGRVTSAAFRPTKKDEGQLSVDRGSLATPVESYERHTVSKGLQSAGTWSLSVGECDGEDLPSYEDSEEDNPAHSLIDFRDLSRNQRKKKAKKLKQHAVKRGPTHLPER